MEDAIEDKKKGHRERRAGKAACFNTSHVDVLIAIWFLGRKADKKKEKNPHEQELTAKQRNPKAFAIQSVARAQKRFHRYAEFRF